MEFIWWLKWYMCKSTSVSSPTMIFVKAVQLFRGIFPTQFTIFSKKSLTTDIKEKYKLPKTFFFIKMSWYDCLSYCFKCTFPRLLGSQRSITHICQTWKNVTDTICKKNYCTLWFLCFQGKFYTSVLNICSM